MDTMIDIFQAILPSTLVFLAAWWLLERFSSKLSNQSRPIAQNDTETVEIEKLKILLPLKLKAYERLVIFLERINPASLIMRQNQSGMSAIQLQLELLKSIREEYEHNQSLQIYVTAETWEIINRAKEEVISLVKISSSKLKAQEANSRELAGIILEIDGQIKDNPVRKAIKALNNEARQSMLL